jgi:hypothetical protein
VELQEYSGNRTSSHIHNQCKNEKITLVMTLWNKKKISIRKSKNISAIKQCG